MASLKADKPACCTQTQSSAGQAKKEPAAALKASSTDPKAPASTKQPVKKAEQKPREPKKKPSGGKGAPKN